MKSSVMFSIVIINWNGQKNLGDLLDKCLESVIKTSYKNFEVIFVDNASTDGSYEHVQSKFDFRFFRNPENLGFVGGNNVGARFSKGEIIVFLNNDTIVDPDWLNEPAELFEKQNIGIVQSNLRLLKDPKIPDSIGHSISILALPIENYFFMNEPSTPVPIFGGKGAAIFVRRELFERLSGFDEDYFFYFEESDLCWRSRLQGYEVYFSPHSIVLHKGGGTFRNGKLLYHREKNTITSMLKCYETRTLLTYFPLKLIVELGGIFYLFFKKPSLAFGNIKALFWVLKNTMKILKKRAVVQRTRVVHDRELFKRRFIIKSIRLIFEYTRSRLSKFEAAA